MEPENQITDRHRNVNRASDADEFMQTGALPRIGRFSNKHLLIFIVVNAIGINLLLVLAGGILFHTFQQPSAVRGVVASLIFHQADDSLRPMLYAVHSFENNPALPIYQSIFFEQHVKFNTHSQPAAYFGHGTPRFRLRCSALDSKTVCWVCTRDSMALREDLHAAFADRRASSAGSP